MKKLEIQIDKKQKELIQLISDLSTKNKSTGLLSGSAGIALLLFYYAKWINSDSIRETAINALKHSFENAFESESLTYCNGAAGLGWCLMHLQKNKLLDCKPDTLLLDIDTVIFESIEKDLSEENYDFLHGAIGKCLYLIERGKFDAKLSDYSKKIFDLAEKDVSDHLKWNYYSPTIEQNTYCLGLAHGLPSIILFYLKLYKENINKEFSKEVIIKCVNFLLSSKLEDPEISLFPNWITKAKNSEVSRLAWCYGDLGIAITLFQAGLILKNEEYTGQSMKILKHSVSRKTFEETMVIDAGFCHGSAGIAYIYYKMFLSTNDEIFKDASDFWYGKTLDFAIHPDGYVGYKSYKNPDYIRSIGLLDGIVGIAFSFLQYQSGKSLTCDSCFLLS